MRTYLFAAIASSILLSGCTFDHRRDVAYSLLFRPDGFENDSAFSAAASARFPAGTAVSELEAFAKSAGGKCWSRDPDGFVCEIATRGQMCAARLIRIQAIVEGSVIKSVSFISGGLGC
jgi:hypothetical protein